MNLGAELLAAGVSRNLSQLDEQLFFQVCGAPAAHRAGKRRGAGASCPPPSCPRTPPEQRWLIEQLWGVEAVGIIGGEPKCGNSFLALDFAVAVASGTACLGHFRAARAARVLLLAAEDPLHVVRERLEGITAARGVGLAICPSSSSPPPGCVWTTRPTASGSPKPSRRFIPHYSSSTPSCACMPSTSYVTRHITRLM
jgi:hypothetical protein